MIKIWPSMDSILVRFVNSLRSFPATLAMSALAFGECVFLLETGAKLQDSSLIFTAFLGVPLMFGVEAFLKVRSLHDVKTRAIAYTIGAAFLGLHFLYIDGDVSQNYLIRYFHTSLIVHLLVALLPYFNFREEKQFWNYNKILILTFLESGLYSGVLYAGLALATVTVNKLFGVFIPKNFYLSLLYFCAIFFHSSVFLSKVNARLESNNDKYTYPIGLQYFVQYLLIPLVTLYTVILYFYMGKILLSLIWPEGYVGWLVSIVSVAGVLNLLLLEPLKESKKWIAAYAKFYYLALAPLLIMLFLAVYQRINAYGVTELRYLLLLLGAVLFALIFYFLLSKNKNIKAVPFILLAALILALAGPVSAYSVSRRSQINALKDLMRDNGLMEGGKAKEADEAEVTEGVARRITNIAQYLVRNHDSVHLEGLFPKDVLRDVDNDSRTGGYSRKRYFRSPRPLLAHIGVPHTTKYTSSNTGERNFSYRIPEENVVLDTKGFSRVYPFNLSNWNTSLTRGSDPERVDIRLRQGPREIALEGYNYDTAISMENLLKSLENIYRSDQAFEQSAFTTGLNTECNCKIVFYQLSGKILKKEHFPDHAKGYVLVK